MPWQPRGLISPILALVPVRHRIPSIYKVKFGSSGATFGDMQPVNSARNYMRTVATDYANTSFVAEVTITSTDIDKQSVYFGLGSGDANNDFFRTPDFQSPAASIMYWGENEIATPTVEVVRNNDGQGADVSETAAPGLGNGTYRVRMTYDWFAKTATFALDFNYAGGPVHCRCHFAGCQRVAALHFGHWFPAGSRANFLWRRLRQCNKRNCRPSL